MGTLNFGFCVSSQISNGCKVVSQGRHGFKTGREKQRFSCLGSTGTRESANYRVGEFVSCRDGVNKRRRSPFRLRSIVKMEEVAEMDESCASVEGNSSYDAIVIGSGIGGLVAATQLAVKGAKVLVLEKYVIPGGSSGFYERDGYTFDVGSSVMFGFSDKVSSYLYSAASIPKLHIRSNVWSSIM